MRRTLLIGILGLLGALSTGCNAEGPDAGEAQPALDSQRPEPAPTDTELGQREQALVSMPTPVGYWKFDEGCATTTVLDSSGNGAHGTRYNGVGCEEDGRIGQSGVFDLTDDRVEVPDRPAFHFTNAMTAAAWIKPGTTITGVRAIVNKWYLYNSFSLSIINGEYAFDIVLPVGPRGVRVPAVPDQWAHVAGVYNGTTVSLYVDGVLRASMAVSGTLQQSSRPVVIGNNPVNSGFGGLIDEVRLYNVALDAQQLRHLGQQVWPNGLSSANSDPFLSQKHNLLRTLRPTVLALNFVNAKDNTAMMSHLKQIANAIKEGSRYHAYRNASAEPMIQYTIKPVDLRDASVPPDYPYRNSTKYPREAPVQGYWGFNYAKLFSQKFAQYYGITAADGHLMDLCEAVNAGKVHEVWIYGDGDVEGDVKAAEVLELKPWYDANRVRIPGQPLDGCAGNGCFDAEDIAALPAHCTRSIRIGWVNHNRGAGCYSHSMGHGMEGTGNRNLIPYLTQYWRKFSDSNLDARYGLPFESWYACPGDTNCVTHASDGNSVSYNVGWAQGTISPFAPACQNVHFPPNARDHYDYRSPQIQLSSCENFRMRNNGSGGDVREVFTSSKFSGYESLAPDCGGDWVMYWMQSVPGYDNQALDDAGQPMLPWWPFYFY